MPLDRVRDREPIRPGRPIAVGPLLRRTSREIVDTDRPSSPAIAVNVILQAKPREIVSRSSNDDAIRETHGPVRRPSRTVPPLAHRAGELDQEA